MSTELLRTKITALGARIARLLQTDARIFFEASVRAAFVEQARPMDKDSVVALKAKTGQAAERAVLALSKALEPEVFLALAPQEDQAAPLTVYPPIEQAIRAFEASLAAFVGEMGLPVDALAPYRLPVRFIDGENLVTLTRNLWKAVARLEEARQEERAAVAEASQAELAKLWDEA